MVQTQEQVRSCIYYVEAGEELLILYLPYCTLLCVDAEESAEELAAEEAAAEGDVDDALAMLLSLGTVQPVYVFIRTYYIILCIKNSTD